MPHVLYLYCDIMLGVIAMTGCVVKPQKDVMGVEFPINAEWDAGYITAGVAFRRARITVKRDDENTFSVHAVGFRDGEKLSSWLIRSFTCETCAKAFALCLVHGVEYAECDAHNRQNFSDAEIFDGLINALLATMGVEQRAWSGLDEGSRHRVSWVARLIVDGKLSLHKAINAWDAVEAENPKLTLAGKISCWFATL